MNQRFINKLKKALESTTPIESIKEVIAEYEELVRLAKWRERVLTNGKTLEKNEKELKRVTKLLEKNGFYLCGDENFDRDSLIKFFDGE